MPTNRERQRIRETSSHFKQTNNVTLSPCQGNEPRRKYISTNPKLCMSSRRLCSAPKWVLIDAYLAVPVKFLPYTAAAKMANVHQRFESATASNTVLRTIPRRKEYAVQFSGSGIFSISRNRLQKSHATCTTPH